MMSHSKSINPIHPKTLSGLPIRISGRLIGLHAVLRPDNQRVMAVMFAEGFKNYLLFVGQADDNTIELEIEEEPKELSIPLP